MVTKVAKFRNKSVVIEAVLFTGDNHWEIQKFVGNKARVTIEGKRRALVIETPNSLMVSYPGDWIVEIEGEFYEPGIFAATYESADTPNSHVALVEALIAAKTAMCEQRWKFSNNAELRQCYKQIEAALKLAEPQGEGKR